MKQKQIIALVSATALAATALAGCGKTSEENTQTTSEENTQTTAVGEAEGTAKEDLPFSKYAETVTVHLGGSMNPNAKILDGMSYEDNAYTRFLKDDLNIEVVYDWIASSSDYDEKMNLCIGSGTIPEMMNVNATQYRALLKYDMIQPLDQYFEDYASDKLKGFVESGGEELKKCITNDKGEMMAIPAPSMMVGEMNEMWIRQDWLDNLGLEVPRTWDEMAAVAEAFVTQDPDGNGEDDTIGILGPGNSNHINDIGDNQFGLDPLFCSFQSYPQYWLQDEDGTVKYGSIQPETRVALEKIQKLYTDKLIDPEMLVRNNCQEAVLSGKVGIFFGPWWSGYTVGEATLAGEADWRAYFTPLSEDGKYYTHMPDPTSKYVVVSKSCKNPEAAFKIISYLVANEQQWTDDGITSSEMSCADFYPLWNGYDNADEIEVSTDTLEKYLAGEITMDDVDFSQHKLLKSDMEAVTELKKEPYDDFSLDKWNLDSDLAKTNLPRLVSLLVGGAPYVNDKYIPVYNAYSGQTETMQAKWANLKKMEEETFAKIIMGKADISEFDTFVENWKNQGGDQILKEINDELSK
ncbi:extracellular solute-binding protein [Roseburia intestinalis]|jgi:putative aldouronate transport system substrate-binding protein|uniref:Extracellular solute-binding protein n=1 Tax=Roseburia intestinalis TaxID=166486 RepID=A0A3R6H3S4_9FIRM|nr:extracellular solute-binding protein [Roseburia intestinalis]RHN11501.1 extracellular solute-binding protein [Roseburia intestinalis]